MIEPNLPALLVVLPLLGAPLCLLFGRSRLAWIIATLISWLGLAISFRLLLQVAGGDTLRYAFGGWAAPWGIEYLVDPLAAFVLVTISLIAALVMPSTWPSIAQEIEAEQQPYFYPLLLLCLAGLLGIVITGDAFNLFVFLEISSLSTYALISLGRNRRALIASYQYLIMGTIGATFFIIGVGLLYMLTGTLNMADLAARIGSVAETNTLRTAFAFIIVGLALKLAMFPLHLWLPNAYAYAPSVISAFLAATATKVALYAMIRFLFSVFGPEFTLAKMHADWLLLPLAAAGVLIGSIVAVFQRDMKRMLAYSSIAQIGYMLLGIGMLSVTGLTASLLHLFNHALMKGALFLTLGALFYRVASSNIDQLAGIAREMPWTTAAFVLGGLSLIGVPMTVGFISKWYLILAAIEKGWWLLVILVLVSSLIAVIYIWRLVEVAYFRPRPDGAVALREAPAVLLVPIWLLVSANLYFGIDARFTAGLTGEIATRLIGAG